MILTFNKEQSFSTKYSEITKIFDAMFTARALRMIAKLLCKMCCHAHAKWTNQIAANK